MSWNNSHEIFDRLEFFTLRCKLCDDHRFSLSVADVLEEILDIRKYSGCVLFLFRSSYKLQYRYCSRSRITEQPVLLLWTTANGWISAEGLWICNGHLSDRFLLFQLINDNIIHCFIHTISDWMLLLKPQLKSLKNSFSFLRQHLLRFLQSLGYLLLMESSMASRQLQYRIPCIPGRL